MVKRVNPWYCETNEQPPPHAKAIVAVAFSYPLVNNPLLLSIINRMLQIPAKNLNSAPQNIQLVMMLSLDNARLLAVRRVTRFKREVTISGRCAEA
ncbi:hypothetical protein ACFQ44_08055 [Levilactobacillus lanxiensis]|uniref:Uncharacterized protein n=1 Tax=Levilactobacillus lanxiensis TaxID=2799568 RepID=A0ABW4D6M9_9LACO